MDLLLSGIQQVLTIPSILWICIGSILGILLGALPGLSATMGIALMLPISFYLPDATGIGLLLAVYCGAVSGASIPAILLGIPGNPNAIATIQDGYAMTKNGHAEAALGSAIIASFIGGIGSLMFLIFLAPLIAKFTLAFGPAEKATLALVGLTIIASVSSKNLAKGILTGAFGMMIAFLGTDPFSGQLRIPFASVLAKTPLAGGINLVPALIGLFGISQGFFDIKNLSDPPAVISKFSKEKIFPSFKKLISMWKIIIQSLTIGTFIGAIPGTGASIAVFLAHNRAQSITNKNKSKLDKIGTGVVEGVIAPEVANNAVTGGALVPTLALGIPGDAATAVLMGALLIKGITPGFELFTHNMSLVYSIFFSLFLANIGMFLFQLMGIRLYPKILTVSLKYLLPLILIFSFIGSYAISGQATQVAIYNMGIALVMGIIGYLFKKYDYPIAPIVLGMILGGMFEENFRRAVKLANGNFFVFFTKPICVVFILIAALSIIAPAFKRKYQK